MSSRCREETPNHIYIRHLQESGSCATGTVKFLKSKYMTREEVLSFINNGMPILEFKEKFGWHAIAQQAIQYYEEVGNGRK